MLRRFAYILGLAFIISSSHAQERLISDQSLRERQTEIEELFPDEDLRIAREYARQNNLPERLSYKDGTVLEIKRLSPTGKPLYYKTFNINSARTISSNEVWEGGSAGYELNGAGIVVGVWDGGVVRTSHNEFDGRARILDNSTEIIDHATHVAGTIAAEGENQNARGMANKSIIESYDWVNDDMEMTIAAEKGLLISNHSYGFIQGWEYNQDKSRWEWWGDPDISQREDYRFGYYGREARTWDEIAHSFSKYLIIKSAGNDRGQGQAPGATHYVLRNGSWVTSNVTRDKDGGPDSYDCIGSQGSAKNILTVGAVQDIQDGYQQPSDVRVASFSAFGPTDDGRIKPDLVANGIGLFSSTSGSDTGYGSLSGTSMSAPSVAGSLALLQQHFRSLRGEYMPASQLKALVLHTADEAGEAGPDYRHGWGLMNTLSATNLISDVPEERFYSDTLENQEVNELSFYSRGMEEIKITIVWHDIPGDVPAVQLNPTDKILVNDLDIRLSRQIDDHSFKPYILDPANPSKPALTGDNTVDNVEQIFVQQPIAGFYTLRLSHKFSLYGGNQPYSIVISGLEKNYIASGYNVLEEANGSILLSSADRYLNNMDVQWLIQADNLQQVSLSFDFFETEENNDILTIYDGADSTASVLATFSGLPDLSDTIITASSDQMFITFTSDEKVTARGFMAKYCTVAPEGVYSIEGEIFPCQFSVSSYFALGQEGADFQWKLSEGWEFTEKSANGIDLSIGDTSSILTLTPYNMCGSGLESVLEIDPLESPPVITQIIGDTLPCAGHSSILASDNLNGATYQWELPPFWVGASESDTLYFIPEGRDPGIVTVTGYNACGRGNEISKVIDVEGIPFKSAILTDKVPPCALTLQEFYVNKQPGYTYYWEVQDDWLISGDPEGDTISVEVGNDQSFLFLTSINNCGESRGNRLFLTAPKPEEAKIAQNVSETGYPELLVTNDRDLERIQWYRNESPLKGVKGWSNPLVVNQNGVYQAETVSEEGCRNMGSDVDGVEVKLDELSYLSYRINESTIVIENASSGTVDFNLISLEGKVLMIGKANEGYNEFTFLDKGIFLLQFFGNNPNQNYKVLF